MPSTVARIERVALHDDASSVGAQVLGANGDARGSVRAWKHTELPQGPRAGKAPQHARPARKSSAGIERLVDHVHDASCPGMQWQQQREVGHLREVQCRHGLGGSVIVMAWFARWVSRALPHQRGSICAESRRIEGFVWLPASLRQEVSWLACSAPMAIHHHVELSEDRATKEPVEVSR
ncbi:hypothetical protein [Nonomuraea sp. NPDC049400]|uniref:hypothetical protein n=1 Tax=Nonomuraea sp. NPDC049400 TaxID=3364352 RepID=UPI0037A00DFF